MSDYRRYNNSYFPWKKNLITFPGALFGALLYLRLMTRRKDTHYLILSLGLGDNICALSYLREYKQQNGYNHVTLVGCSAHTRQVYQMYADVAEDVIYLKQRELLALQYFSRSLIGQNYISFFHRDRITFTNYQCTVSHRLMWGAENFPMAYFLKTLLYQIAPDAVPERPHIPDVEIGRFIDRYGIQKGRTVFLNPFAKTLLLDAAGLFQMLTDALVRRGYAVVTLTANEAQAPVAGTAALICDLNEAFRLIEYGGIVIGLRSGFLDVMAFADCKLISIEDPEYGRREFYNLEKLGVNGDCHSVLYENERTACDEVLKLIG